MERSLRWECSECSGWVMFCRWFIHIAKGFLAFGLKLCSHNLYFPSLFVILITTSPGELTEITELAELSQA